MPLSSRLRKLLSRNRQPAQQIDLDETRKIGLDESTCEINGAREDWSKMPIPPPRLRPLTAQYEDGAAREEVHPQRQSILFFRLPLEVRQLVYEHLLGGGRLIELEFDLGNPDGYHGLHHASARGDHYQDRLRWRWWHFVYADRKFSTPPYLSWPVWVHRDSPKRTFNRQCKLSCEWLRTCRRGYMESIRFVYSTNTFVISQTEELVLRLPMLWPESHLSMITSLILQFRIHPGRNADIKNDRLLKCTYTPLPIHRQVLEFLSSPAPDGLRFPRLRSLRVVYSICPYEEVPRWEEGTLRPFDEELQDAWCVPWEELLASGRPWWRFEVTVPTDWERCFQELCRRRSKLQRNDFVLTGEFTYGGFLRWMDYGI